MRMLHRSFFTVASLSTIAFVFGGAGSASAHWHSHGSSGGSWGSHGSSGGSWGSHGSSGGSWGSHGSSGGSWGSHGSSGGSWGSHGSSGGYYVAANVPVAGAASGTRVAYLNVKVPENAAVYLQDQRTTLTGATRRFVTPELEDGKPHFYTVKVEVERNGRTLTKTTQAPIQAGQEVEVAVLLDDRTPNALVASVTPAVGR